MKDCPRVPIHLSVWNFQVFDVLAREVWSFVDQSRGPLLDERRIDSHSFAIARLFTCDRHLILGQRVCPVGSAGCDFQVGLVFLVSAV